MKKVNPIFIGALVAAVILVVYVKINNPYREYGTKAFWVTATVEDVQRIPEEALAPGNKNGSVLMWAAMASNNPGVITALVGRGVDVNEPDVFFGGTPLSSAAGSNSNPEIITELINLGAKVNMYVGSNDKTPLIIAAELNPSPEIIEALIVGGADVNYKDLTGRTALEQALRFENRTVVDVLKAHSN